MSNRNYLPERGDIIWIDFEPTKGKEIGKLRPALVLTSKAYHSKKRLLMCCPITTSLRGGLEEVPIDGLGKPSAVVSSMVQTLSWTDRNVSFIQKATKDVQNEVLLRLLPLLGAENLLQ